jgi:type IV secretory pathway component VirB8
MEEQKQKEQSIEKEILVRINALSIEVDEVLEAVRKMKRYMMLTFVISILVIVVPLIGLVFAVPYILSVMTSMYSGL